MSLASLNIASAADEGRVMTVVHPDHRTPLLGADGQPITITLRGKDSEAYVSSVLANRTKAVETIKEGGKYSANEDEAETNLAFARCTVAWNGIPKCWVEPGAKTEAGADDETPIPFSVETAAKLYSNRGVRWLREQAEKFITTRANFLRG